MGHADFALSTSIVAICGNEDKMHESPTVHLYFHTTIHVYANVHAAKNQTLNPTHLLFIQFKKSKKKKKYLTYNFVICHMFFKLAHSVPPGQRSCCCSVDRLFQ